MRPPDPLGTPGKERHRRDSSPLELRPWSQPTNLGAIPTYQPIIRPVLPCGARHVLRRKTPMTEVPVAPERLLDGPIGDNSLSTPSAPETRAPGWPTLSKRPRNGYGPTLRHH